MTSCPYCAAEWSHHSTRCEGGVPAVDLNDSRGLAGRVISGYQMLGRIGEGGMGTVYLAVDNITEGQLDAVKVLNRDLVVDRERMRREAITANRVSHPNVCRVYNYVEAFDERAGETLTLIAMELVRGPTLQEIQERSGGVLELNRAARVVREVASALQAVHAEGIVHRDIKPTNIIVTNDPDGTERVKLVDFGIAKKEGSEGQDLTEVGHVAATVHYASPEHLMGNAENRSDIYSLAVVFFELLTGRRPFEAPNQAVLFAMILDPGMELPRLAEIRPEVRFPRALQPVLDRALEREPSKRYSTASEFAAAVGRLVPDLAETVVGPVPGFGAPGPIPTIPSKRSDPYVGRPREPGLKERVGQWLRRGPLAVKVGAAAGLVGLTVVAIVLAWDGDTLPPGGAALSVASPSSSLVSGDSWQLVATRGEDTVDVLWESERPEIAAVDRSGNLQARKAGTTGILAILDGEPIERFSVSVRPGPIDSVAVSSDSIRLDVGDNAQLTAVGMDAFKNPLIGLAATWNSEQPAIAVVDSFGLVTGRRQGQAIIVAQIGSFSDSVEVVVVGQAPGPGSPDTTEEEVEGLCPDPVSRLLQGLEDQMDNALSITSRVETATACYHRSDLSDQNRAWAAFIIGESLFLREQCSDRVKQWYREADRLDPGQGPYLSAIERCSGQRK
ncbi:protein kinase [Gemmatimonadota bacterium]